MTDYTRIPAEDGAMNIPEQPAVPPKELANIWINDFGGSPVAEHNMPCAVCLINPAVYLMDSGEFSPCWRCQKEGYRLIDLGALPWVVRKYLLWSGKDRPLGRFH